MNDDDLIKRGDARRVMLAYASSYSVEEAETAIAALPAAPIFITVKDAARVPEIAALIDAARELHKNASSSKSRIRGGVGGQTIDASLRSTMHDVSQYDLDVLDEAIRAIAGGDA